MTAPGISEIAHVNVTVPPEKLDAAKAFYGAALELEEIPRPDALASRGGAWYRIGRSELHLSTEAGADGSISKRHVCFRVADAPAAEAALTANGYPIERPTAEIEGVRRFFIRDPGGNRVEISE